MCIPVYMHSDTHSEIFGHEHTHTHAYKHARTNKQTRTCTHKALMYTQMDTPKWTDETNKHTFVPMHTPMYDAYAHGDYGTVRQAAVCV